MTSSTNSDWEIEISGSGSGSDSNLLRAPPVDPRTFAASSPKYVPASPEFSASSPKYVPASPEFSASSPTSSPVRPQAASASQVKDRPSVPIEPLLHPVPIDALPSMCQVCMHWFEPGKHLAHRCKLSCTSVICGMCLAGLDENKCVQNCGSRYAEHADEALTKDLYTRGLQERVRKAESENEELKASLSLCEKKSEDAIEKANDERVRAEHNFLFVDMGMGELSLKYGRLRYELEESDERARGFENELMEYKEQLADHKEKLELSKDALHEQENEIARMAEVIARLKKEAAQTEREKRKREEMTLAEAIANVNRMGGVVTFPFVDKRRKMDDAFQDSKIMAPIRDRDLI